MICYHNVFFWSYQLIIYVVQITKYFEFLIIKSISFIVLTKFFNFNELFFNEVLKQPGYFIF